MQSGIPTEKYLSAKELILSWAAISITCWVYKQGKVGEIVHKKCKQQLIMYRFKQTKNHKNNYQKNVYKCVGERAEGYSFSKNLKISRPDGMSKE